MALLRISDYLQIQSTRAPQLTFRYKYIRSKISELEFKAHQAVKDITSTHDDPESLQIYAKPEAVDVFLRLRNWIADIQSEIDKSWAVLGEVYGAHPTLRSLGLRFRRLHSNLDALEKFKTTASYIPDRIRFEVARAQLLKLLIGPLYGNDPSYGVRELMQNAIDAVREYDAHVRLHPGSRPHERRQQEADVVIELHAPDDKGVIWMSVSDQGIGMTSDVIRDYFLRAGASYRKSEHWQAEFERDTEGKLTARSRVVRSGRFGVGALAAFLIGDEIEVETRYVDNAEGYRFSTTLESEAISVKRETSLAVGTSIRIRVDPEKYGELIGYRWNTVRPAFWDWYCCDKPNVMRIFPHRRKVRKNRYAFPQDFSSDDWRKLPFEASYEVYWTNSSAPSLICNGLFICDSGSIRTIPAANLKRSAKADFLRYPKVAVVDADGEFPLRLQRDGIQTADYPFGADLARDVLTDMIAWLFFNGPERIAPFDSRDFTLSNWMGYSADRESLVMKRDGYGLKIATLLNDVAVTHAISVEPPCVLESVKNDTFLFVFTGDLAKGSPRWELSPLNIVDGDGKEIEPSPARRVEYFPLKASRKGRKPLRVEKVGNFIVEHHEDRWRMMALPKTPSANLRISLVPPVSYYGREYWTHALQDFYFTDAKFQLKRWLIDEIWDELFDGEWLPFDRKERLSKFPKAAKTLSRYRQSANKAPIKPA
jgi:hypothetical protein